MNQHIQHTPIHGDGCKPIERVRRVVGDYELDDYEWDPDTGVAVCTYERITEPCGSPDDASDRSHVTVTRSQPSGRWHAGWRMWNGRFTERF